MIDDPRDDEADLGFAPAVSATGTDHTHEHHERTTSRAGRLPRLRRRGLGRRVGATAALFAALACVGGVYAAFASSSSAASTGVGNAAAGRQLFENSCITCHGANLQGVEGQGPALIGVGSAAVYFQVATGRMPLVAQGAEADAKEARYNEQQIDDLGAYVQSVGGGPQLPAGNVRGGAETLADGGALFRLNCASCHGVTFNGGALSAGKYAPTLDHSTNREIYAAMLSGPESMPVFSNNQLTPLEKRSIINYVQTLKASANPGGDGIARIGPVSEAIVIWTVGVGAVMVAILWIGSRAR